MNKKDFTEQLRATARELQPLIQSTIAGTMTWDGAKYAKNSGEAKTPNPYALSWWLTLNTIAELIEAQEALLSDKQIAYLDRLLFGGMGSFNDLSFDTKSEGDLANTVNARLNDQRRNLYVAFKGQKK